MASVDARLVSSLRAQLRARTGVRVGWKLGVGDRERIGGHIAVGHLTSATRLEPGATYERADGKELHADAPVARGDHVEADLGKLGRVSLQVLARS